jgi:hypothetical protein
MSSKVVATEYKVAERAPTVVSRLLICSCICFVQIHYQARYYQNACSTTAAMITQSNRRQDPTCVNIVVNRCINAKTEHNEA